MHPSRGRLKIMDIASWDGHQRNAGGQGHHSDVQLHAHHQLDMDVPQDNVSGIQYSCMYTRT
jgi:hypothetical protein